MTDLIERAKAVADRLEQSVILKQFPTGNAIRLQHPAADEAADIIHELIAQVEAHAEFVEIERLKVGKQ